MKNPILITGHRNPDTDSICAAIAYADLKSQLNENVLPIRLGKLNPETTYVLNRFNVKAPKLMPKLETQIRDIVIDEKLTVNENATIKEAWDLMSYHQRKAVAITDDQERLLGIATMGQITDVLLSLVKNDYKLMAMTPYENIAKVVWGNVLIEPKDYDPSGIISISSGVLVDKKEIGFNRKIVIVSTREHSIIKAIQTGASLVVVCFAKESQISEEIRQMARDYGCGIVYTTLDMFSTSQSIAQAIPIKFIMTKDLVTFHNTDTLEEVKNVINKSRYRTYPVVDASNLITGFLSRYHLWNYEKIKLILVDHNEINQSIKGIEEADIIEIIDHHRLGDIATNAPVMFRNEIIGSTCSIITKLYQENKITPSKEIAGILLGAIISDTMNFNSPTCTPEDRVIGEYLAKIAEVEIEDYANEIFRASATLSNKSIEEIILTDFKEFDIEGYDVAISQINVIDSDKVFEMKDDLKKYLEIICNDNKYDLGVVMITDINDKGSYVITAGSSQQIFDFAFEGQKSKIGGLEFIQGVLSRKKQIIPNIAYAVNKFNSR